MSLDDELLMLAGEDDEDTKLSSPPPRRKRSSPPTSASPAKKRSRQTPSKKPRSKRAKKTDSDDEEDDDDEDDDSSVLSEAPSSDEVSSQSDADEAMDLASSSEDEEDSVRDLYPLEGKYKDTADMQRLLAMEEIAREAELAERAAQIERAQQDRHLRNLLKSRTAASEVSGGAGGAGSGGDASTRRSARTKSMPKKKEETTKRGKLEELKKAREDRSTRAAGSGKADRGGDDDGHKRRSLADEEDDKTGFAEELYAPAKEEREIQVADVNRARIGRTGMGKLCDYPGFEETVKDCFVRVSLYDREKDMNAYRIGQIRGFVTGKSYIMLEGQRRTDLHVRISHGLSERSFAMEFLSDSPMTDSEFQRFKKQLEFDKVPLPTLSFVEKKAKGLRALDSRVFTPEEVSAMVAKRNKNKIDPVQIVMARARLKQKREAAVTNGDEAEILRIDKELQELEDSAGRPLARADSQMDRLARLNAENRKRNIAELRKAELDEKRAARKAAEEAERLGKMSNPFMRVKTKARVMHSSVEVRNDKADGEASASSSSGAAGGGEESNATPKGVGLIGNGAKKGRRMGGVDDVIASLDFGIDIEI